MELDLGLHHCDYTECRRRIQGAGVTTTKHFGEHGTRTFHYCDEDHANEHALERLRGTGL